MRFFLLILWILSYSVVFAQRPDGTKGFVYKKELSFGVRVPTQGWALFSDIGRFITVNQRRVIQFEIQELKHSKEYKELSNTITISAQTPKPFYYGKQNNFYSLHFSIGRQKLLAERGEKSPVELRITYLGGAALGLLKPYYLYIDIEQKGTSNSILIAEKYDPENPEHFIDLTRSYIYGAAGFGNGLDQIKIIPGLHGKIGLNFDWATYDEYIKAVEVGLMLDVFPKKVPIMILENNKQYFANLYFSFQFGKRW